MSVEAYRTKHGFVFGSAEVSCFFTHKKGGKETGAVTIGLKTPKYEHAMQIYVTKTGKVRVFSRNAEWKPEK